MANVTDVVGYSGEAAIYCVECAVEKWGEKILDDMEDVEDSEGNPVRPVFGDCESNYDVACDSCFEEIDVRAIGDSLYLPDED